MVCYKLEMKLFRAVFFAMMITFCSCKNDAKIQPTSSIKIKDTVVANFEIKGVSYVATNSAIDSSNITPLNKVNCNWIAQMPFAHGYDSSPQLEFDQSSLWWGETNKGIIETTLLARKKGIRTMLKPQIWIGGSYTGTFTLTNETDWQLWESNYLKYVFNYAHLADSLNIEMFCIGTELKLVVEQRPMFFNKLIDSIRTFYDGKLIYAANWDDYKAVPFWGKLDYIGIDGYFPLSTDNTPSVADMVASWQSTISAIEQFKTALNKDVIFAEIGYKSVDQCAYEPWNPTSNTVNMQAQSNSYQAFFEAFANKPWFKGAFLWKWYPKHENSGGFSNKDYTPQNKPAEAVIEKCF